MPNDTKQSMPRRTLEEALLRLRPAHEDDKDELQDFTTCAAAIRGAFATLEQEVERRGEELTAARGEVTRLRESVDRLTRRLESAKTQGRVLA